MGRLSSCAIIALIVSYVCIFTVSIYQIFSFEEGRHSFNSLVNAILFIHLLMLLLMIFYKCFVLVKVGRLYIELNK